MSNPIVFIGEEIHTESDQAKSATPVFRSGPSNIAKPFHTYYSYGGRQTIYCRGATHVIANDGNNTVVGSSKNDFLYGRDGGDILIGDDGDDVLWGGEGSYTLVGGEGNNYLHGGTGSNIYAVNPYKGSYHTIHNFTSNDEFLWYTIEPHNKPELMITIRDFDFTVMPLRLSKEEKQKGIVAKVQFGKSIVAFENLSLDDGAVLWALESEKVEDLSPRTALFYKEVTRLTYQKAPNLLKVEKFKTDSVVAIKR